MSPLPGLSPLRPLMSLRPPAALLGAVLLAGCMRSGPLETDGIDCGVGVRVVVDGSAFCVYRPPDEPLLCPEVLPNRFVRDGVVVCARQVRPAAGLLERAIGRVVDDDGGIYLVDAGLDAGERQPPFIVDAGGATGADF